MEKKQKILIVDDKVANLVALEEVLLPIDATVVRALSGQEALSLSLQNEFSLAILDVNMPGMDGYEVAEFFRGDKKTRLLPLIFVTASSPKNNTSSRGTKLVLWTTLQNPSPLKCC